MDDVLDPGTNVVRFPSGRAARPLMERVCEVEPDVWDVLFAADSLGLDLPAAALRDRVDEETARHIAEQVLPLALCERRLALDGLVAAVAAVAAAALRACADAAWASGHCTAALRDVEQARREGGHWMDPLEERAEVLRLQAGTLLVLAYRRCQEAHGVARAVGLARRGESWTPYDAAETTAWMAECGAGSVTAGGAAPLRGHAAGG
jgi:hypothetical protein